jgi:hypothetical protein
VQILVNLPAARALALAQAKEPVICTWSAWGRTSRISKSKMFITFFFLQFFGFEDNLYKIASFLKSSQLYAKYVAVLADFKRHLP